MGAVGKDRHLESDLSILIRSWGADASGSLFAKLEHERVWVRGDACVWFNNLYMQSGAQ